MLDKAKLVGEHLCQGENDYETGRIFYGLFLASKIKYRLTLDNYGVMQEHKTFKRFNDSKRLIDRSQKFSMIEVNKYLLCCLKAGRSRSITELSYQQ